ARPVLGFGLGLVLDALHVGHRRQAGLVADLLDQRGPRLGLRQRRGLLQPRLRLRRQRGRRARRRLGGGLARRQLLLALAHVVDLAIQLALAALQLPLLLAQLGGLALEIALTGLLRRLDVGAGLLRRL